MAVGDKVIIESGWGGKGGKFPEAFLRFTADTPAIVEGERGSTVLVKIAGLPYIVKVRKQALKVQAKDAALIDSAVTTAMTVLERKGYIRRFGRVQASGNYQLIYRKPGPETKMQDIAFLNVENGKPSIIYSPAKVKDAALIDQVLAMDGGGSYSGPNAGNIVCPRCKQDVATYQTKIGRFVGHHYNKQGMKCAASFDPVKVGKANDQAITLSKAEGRVLLEVLRGA
jgi:hypothetical protein